MSLWLQLMAVEYERKSCFIAALSKELLLRFVTIQVAATAVGKVETGPLKKCNSVDVSSIPCRGIRWWEKIVGKHGNPSHASMGEP